MCSLFGLIDYQNTLTTRQKNHILQVISKECEVRGTGRDGYCLQLWRQHQGVQAPARRA